MTQLHRILVTNAVWAVAWTLVILGVAYDDVRLLGLGIYAGLAGVVCMTWVIAMHVEQKVADRVTADLLERDRRRTVEMAEALVRAQHDGLHAVE